MNGVCIHKNRYDDDKFGVIIVIVDGEEYFRIFPASTRDTRNRIYLLQIMIQTLSTTV